ncbi:MAG TPA: hypothetical protein VLM80_02220 [Anaerolineales bacterium]|nr:hypothetical protein [Anaerolineales bacterium]
MNDWVGLLIVVIVIVIVWWLLTRFAKQGPEEFHVEHKHENETHTSQAPSRAASVALPETRTSQVPPRAASVNLQESETSQAPSRAASIHLPETPSKPDDLTILEGIGPKVNKLLQSQGIATFAQLAEANTGRLKTILEQNGLRFMDPASWPQQAKLAAEGKMDELQSLMDNLKGGRKK